MDAAEMNRSITSAEKELRLLDDAWRTRRILPSEQRRLLAKRRYILESRIKKMAIKLKVSRGVEP